MLRWGAGGARVEQVHVEEGPEDGFLEIAMSYETTALDRAVFCIGFEDESGHEIGAAASPLLSLEGNRGSVRCTIRPLPFRSGIYFPVVAILSPDGSVRDRWRLERAVVIERDGEASIVNDFGPVQIPSVWVGAEARSISGTEDRP